MDNCKKYCHVLPYILLNFSKSLRKNRQRWKNQLLRTNPDSGSFVYVSIPDLDEGDEGHERGCEGELVGKPRLVGPGRVGPLRVLEVLHDEAHEVLPVLVLELL